MKKSHQRLTSLLLAILMVLSLLPTAAWAAAEETPEVPTGEPVTGSPTEGETPEPAPDGPDDEAGLMAGYAGTVSEAQMQPPTIPGWRQQTSLTLDTSKKYIIVSQSTPSGDAAPNYYVFYPNPVAEQTITTGQILGHSGTVTASLDLSGDTPTVTHMDTESTKVENITLEDCAFLPFAHDSTSTDPNYVFQFSTVRSGTTRKM